MNGELLRIVEAIHRDKAIDKETLFLSIETALTTAAKKRFGARDNTTIRIDRKTGSIVSEGAHHDIDPAELGRIAAQTAKQVIFQKIREAEKTAIIFDFEGKRHDIVTGTILRQEGVNLIVLLGKVEAMLGKREQVQGETYRLGDRVRVLVLDVRRRGPRVVVELSRSHADFVRKLFELEVPEISEKIVEIKGLAREAGFRTKIAVNSTNPKVDSVGACVGIRGSRIRTIVEELNGEKVDIIRWDERPDSLIRNALKPAEVQEIQLATTERRARVLVGKDQLSLAIGKGGQNVRLASRLTGWELDIFCPEAEAEKAAAAAAAAATATGAEESAGSTAAPVASETAAAEPSPTEAATASASAPVTLGVAAPEPSAADGATGTSPDNVAASAPSPAAATTSAAEPAQPIVDSGN